MKRVKRRINPAKRASGRPSPDRRLVRIDQEPLRRELTSECRRMLTKVQKARAEWKRFEREDQPAFGRWMAANFGQLLTDLRALEAQTHEKEMLVELVQTEMLFGRSASPQRAYARIMKERDARSPKPEEAGPGPADGDQSASNDADFDGPENFTENEDREIFERALNDFFGLDPEQLDKPTYDKMFRDFKEQVLGDGGHEVPPDSGRLGAAQSSVPKDARVKEIYRMLVRRLHPDLRADGDASVSALWHEVQEAYEAGNLDRLETLLALTDLESNQAGKHTTFSQLKSVLLELGRSLRALSKSLRGARREPAWNFVGATDHTELRNRVGRELESARAELRNRLNRLEAMLADWARPPAERPRKSRRVRCAQDEFLF